jgi:hypothetical protein
MPDNHGFYKISRPRESAAVSYLLIKKILVRQWKRAFFSLPIPHRRYSLGYKKRGIIAYPRRRVLAYVFTSSLDYAWTVIMGTSPMPAYQNNRLAAAHAYCLPA